MREEHTWVQPVLKAKKTLMSFAAFVARAYTADAELRPQLVHLVTQHREFVVQIDERQRALLRARGPGHASHDVAETTTCDHRTTARADPDSPFLSRGDFAARVSPRPGECGAASSRTSPPDR